MFEGSGVGRLLNGGNHSNNGCSSSNIALHAINASSTIINGNSKKIPPKSASVGATMKKFGSNGNGAAMSFSGYDAGSSLFLKLIPEVSPHSTTFPQNATDAMVNSTSTDQTASYIDSMMPPPPPRMPNMGNDSVCGPLHLLSSTAFQALAITNDHTQDFLNPMNESPDESISQSSQEIMPLPHQHEEGGLAESSKLRSNSLVSLIDTYGGTSSDDQISITEQQQEKSQLRHQEKETLGESHEQHRRIRSASEGGIPSQMLSTNNNSNPASRSCRFVSSALSSSSVASLLVHGDVDDGLHDLGLSSSWKSCDTIVECNEDPSTSSKP